MDETLVRWTLETLEDMPDFMEIKGVIYGEYESNDYGTIKAAYFPFLGKDINPFVAMDGYSDSAHRGALALYNSRHQIRAPLYTKLDLFYQSPSVLWLESLEIAPEFRGQRHGTSAIKQLIAYWGLKADILALEAFPLGGAYTGAELKNAEKRLNNFYKQNGFIRARANSDVMVRRIDKSETLY